MGKQNKQVTFEESLSHLEAIVKKLETGNLSLDQSLEEFQQGVKAYKDCNDMLNTEEGKVTLIREENGEVLENLDFEEL